MGEYWGPYDTGIREKILLEVASFAGIGSRIGFSRTTGLNLSNIEQTPRARESMLGTGGSPSMETRREGRR
jgi:hypothetical protein